MSTQKKEYKVSNLSEIGPFHKREVEIEDGKYKVLLTNVKGKIYATGHKCTHYGAPLVNGVLNADGRLVCPWHGACFKVDTGDIEDAPALDALVTYQVRVDEKDGSIFVSASEEDLKKDGRRKPTICSGVKGKDEVEKGVVIVGGGAAGLTTAEGLREFGYDGKVTVLSKENHFPIDRTKLSKTLMTDKEKLQWRDESFYRDLKVEFKKGVEVKSIDKEKKTVTLEDGTELGFDHLVLASGSAPKRLPLPGFDLENVFTLRTLADAEKIVKEKGEEKKKIAIVGSSFIGLELAALLVKDHEVTVVGQSKTPLDNVLGEKIGNFIKGLHEAAGVKFLMNSKISKAFPSESNAKKSGGIEFEDGSKLNSDFIILGVGVNPDTSYLKSSGFNLEKDGGIQVDRYLKVKGEEAKDIYAVGDIAHFPYSRPGKEGEQSLRIEHWNVAQNHGRTVALNICGKKESFEHIPYFWSAQGTQVRYCGNTKEGFDDVLVVGSMEEKKFVAYYTKGEEVLAVLSVGYDPAVSKSSELMRMGKMPTKSELAGGLDIRNAPIEG